MLRQAICGVLPLILTVQVVKCMATSRIHSTGTLLDVSCNVTNATECRQVHHCVSREDACWFVKNHTVCSNGESYFSYVQLIYCDFPLDMTGLAIFIEFLLLVIYFIGLAITADRFFCPALVVMARVMRLSDNIAGVTLLAFGNGAPDVFSAIAAIKTMENKDVGLAVGALMGAGMLLTTLIAGTISVISPFDAMRRPLIRDILFLLGGISFVFYILYTGKITMAQSIGFICLFLTYVVVVIVGRYIYQKQKAARLDLEDDNTGHVSDDNPEEINYDVNVISEARGRTLREYPASASASNSHQAVDDSDSESTPLIMRPKAERTESGALADFIRAIRPFDPSEFSEMRWYKKVYNVLQTPVSLLLCLMLPVVDYSLELDGWNRHLCCINVVLGIPVAFALASMSSALYLIGGVMPVVVIVLCGSSILGLVVFRTSVNEEPPRYHKAFAFLGFAVAVVWVQLIASEIVSLLESVGVALNISSTILGVTLLAFGNSIGDFITDISVARRNLPRIGISACYGGPFFNMMLGIGIPFLIKTIAEGPVDLTFDSVQLVLISSLMAVLVLTLIIVPICKFRYTRFFGFFLYFLYALFLVLIVLAETNIL